MYETQLILVGVLVFIIYWVAWTKRGFIKDIAMKLDSRDRMGIVLMWLEAFLFGVLLTGFLYEFTMKM